MRFEPLPTLFSSAGRFPSDQKPRSEDGLLPSQEHLASDHRPPPNEGPPPPSSRSEPTNRKGIPPTTDRQREAVAPSATPPGNGPPLAEPSQATSSSAAFVDGLSQATKSVAEGPHKLLRQAAEPAYLRIRQDCQGASERLLPLLEYLSRHLFDSSLNVNQLKLACGIRDNSIVILFHAEIGQTPKAYISGRRLETAARLLRETDLKIWQISDLVGYSTLGVFSKAFDRWAGLRPQYYRARESSRKSGRIPQSQPIFDGEFVERAIAGRLNKEESKRLIARLYEIYGSNLSTPETNLKTPQPSSEAPGSATE